MRLACDATEAAELICAASPRMLRTRFALAQVIRSEQGARMPVTIQTVFFATPLPRQKLRLCSWIRSPDGFEPRHAAPMNGFALRMKRRLAVWREPSPERGTEFANCPQDALIDFSLSFSACFQAAPCNGQRMVASFDDVKFVRSAHFSADPLE